CEEPSDTVPRWQVENTFEVEEDIREEYTLSEMDEGLKQDIEDKEEEIEKIRAVTIPKINKEINSRLSDLFIFMETPLIETDARNIRIVNNDKDYGSGYLVKKSSFHNELNIDPDIYPDVGIINPIQVSNPKQEFFFSQFSYIFYPFYSNEKISFENYKQGIGVPNSAIQRLKDNSDIYKITTLQNLYNTAGNETYVEFSKAVTYNSYNDNLDNLFIGGSKVNYEEIPYVALLDMYGAAVPGEGNPMSPFGWLW